MSRIILEETEKYPQGNPELMDWDNGAYQEEEDEEKMERGLCQFSTQDNISFFPTYKTVKKLPPSYYEINNSPNHGIYFEKLPVISGDLIRFPDSISDLVIDEISKFWEREDIFKQYSLNYKRGILLYGPPGSGKSSMLKLVCNDVISRGGCVVKFTVPDLFVTGMRSFRKIEPDKPVVVLMEDIDAIVERHNESTVLNILDGVDELNKVLFLATTNYPEKLGKRVLNRPSRFDRRIKIGPPDNTCRKLYFEHIFNEHENNFEFDLDKWVEDTDGMSIAHLKELFISVCILGNDYEDAIQILNEMHTEVPNSGEDYRKKVGFRSNR